MPRRAVAEHATAVDRTCRIPVIAPGQRDIDDVGQRGIDHCVDTGVVPARLHIIVPAIAGARIEGRAQRIVRRGADREVAAIERDAAIVEGLFLDRRVVTVGHADIVVERERHECQIRREAAAVADTALARIGFVVGREAVAHETLIAERVEEELELELRPIIIFTHEIAEEGDRIGLGEILVADIDVMPAQMRRADTRIETARSGVGIATTEALRIGRQPAGRQLAIVEIAIAIRVRDAGIAAGGVGTIVDQVLGQTVPARRLHIAVGVVKHAAHLERPAIVHIEVGGRLQELMLRRDAVVEAAGILDLAIDIETAVGIAEAHRNTGLEAAVLLVIGPESARDLARHVGEVAGFFRNLRGLGLEVHRAADLARTEIRRGRAAQNVHAGGGAERRLIGAAVFDALEAVEIGFGQKTAHIQRAFHTIERRGERARRHGGQVIDRRHAISVKRIVADECRRARRFEQRLVDTKKQVARLLLQQPRLVAFGNHDHLGRLLAVARFAIRGLGRRGGQGHHRCVVTRRGFSTCFLRVDNTRQGRGADHQHHHRNRGEK